MRFGPVCLLEQRAAQFPISAAYVAEYSAVREQGCSNAFQTAHAQLVSRDRSLALRGNGTQRQQSVGLQAQVMPAAPPPGARDADHPEQSRHAHRARNAGAGQGGEAGVLLCQRLLEHCAADL